MINIPDWIWFLILLFSIGLTLGSYQIFKDTDVYVIEVNKEDK